MNYERLFNPNWNPEINPENFVYNEMATNNFTNHNKIKNEFNERDERKAMKTDKDESGRGVEEKKDDKEKILNNRHNNLISNPKVSSNSIISSIEIYPTQNINKDQDLKIHKSKEIHSPKQKNNKLKNILFYPDIIKFSYIFMINKLYISDLKNNLNYESNWLFIFIFSFIIFTYYSNETLIKKRINLENISLFNKRIILIIIFGIISYSSKRKFKIVLSTSIKYIKNCFNQIIYSVKKFRNNTNNLKRKREIKRNIYIIKNNITNNNYFVNAIIKSIIIINLFYITISSIYDFNFLQESKITLKVKGKGEKVILNSNFRQYLTQVYINGNIKSEKTYKYTFDKEDNTVELFLDENIENTNNMFKECTSITEINLSNFDSSKVTSMDNMFEGCSSLTSIDLSNINTQLVKRMAFMFSRCTSLTSLDLSRFDTTKVTTMDSMFSHCSSLSSLDLSKFEIAALNSFDTIFMDCTNLEYVNMNKFNVNKLKQTMFENVPKNLAICIQGSIDNLFSGTSNNLNNTSNSSSTNQYCFVKDCSSNWKTKQKKIINNNNNQCIDSCDGSSQYKYEYNGKCINACPKGTLSGSQKCKCELDKCLLCPPVALKNNLCTQCNTDYYPKENDPSNLGEYKDCYKNPEGYYLDSTIYKKCYETCKTCNTQGDSENHNCLTCNENFPFIIEKNNKFNCVSNCSYYYYKKENNYYCTNTLNCTNEYPKLKPNSRECTDMIDAGDIMANIVPEEAGESKLQKINYYNNLIQYIDNSFTSPQYDTSNIENGKDEIIKTDQMTVTFTTTENQKNNLYNNMTSIDLGECETLLRDFYHLSINETLYIKKMDIVQEETKALKVEYDVYSKLNGPNLEKLNLTICGEVKISLLIPFNINKDLDKFNTSSGYYNDVCYTTTSDDGTDISLKDRKSDYANNDLIVCQEGCIFSEYDYEKQVAKCNCYVKESPSSIADMKIDKTKLLENFKDIKNIVNFEFLKCYKILFTKEGILNNYGCYIVFIIFLFHILSIFIFRVNSFQILEKKIISIATKKSKEQSTAVKGIKDIKKNSKIDDKEIFIFRPKKEKNTEKFQFSNKKSIKNSTIKKPTSKNLLAKNIISNSSNSKNSIISNGYLKNSTVKISIIKKSKMKNTTKSKSKIKGNPTKRRSIKNSTIKDKINPKTIKNEKAKIGMKDNFKNYIDEEINGLPYIIAVKFDKRTYCQYYGSLIKTQHNLICVLFNNADYNSGIVKIDLFLVGFVIEYTVNALFYNDDTMHEIYESKGAFDLETQLPIIVYSTIISYILNSPLNFLALTNDPIIDFKQGSIKNIMKRAKKLVNILNFKFVVYFIISTLFLLFFWYYISMFGAIYKNTQFHLLKDILSSFLFSLFLPFLIYLLPGLFRIPALSSKKNARPWLYKFSKFLQSF